MPEHPRIEDLRRRVQKDPASIAFAQLAEEYRRAGQYQEAVEVCRAGLAIHPGYLSARVTLGRALQHPHELALPFIQMVQFKERAPHGDACGQIAGMNLEAGAADVEGFLELAGAPVLFGELRKRN